MAFCRAIRGCVLCSHVCSCGAACRADAERAARVQAAHEAKVAAAEAAKRAAQQAATQQMLEGLSLQVRACVWQSWSGTLHDRLGSSGSGYSILHVTAGSPQTQGVECVCVFVAVHSVQMAEKDAARRAAEAAKQADRKAAAAQLRELEAATAAAKQQRKHQQQQALHHASQEVSSRMSDVGCGVCQGQRVFERAKCCNSSLT